MTDPNNYQNMNKYQVYRKIRSDRAYRTLGKMNIYRVIAGILLLVLVLLLSGAVSDYFAVRGHFKAADTLMIAPGWMEKYKPAHKAFIEAGVLYQDGDYEGAYKAFAAIDGLDAAKSMKESSAVKLSAAALEKGDYDSAYETAALIDASLLTQDSAKEYRELCGRLLEYYSDPLQKADAGRVSALQGMISSVDANGD